MENQAHGQGGQYTSGGALPGLTVGRETGDTCFAVKSQRCKLAIKQILGRSVSPMSSELLF